MLEFLSEEKRNFILQYKFVQPYLNNPKDKKTYIEDIGQFSKEWLEKLSESEIRMLIKIVELQEIVDKSRHLLCAKSLENDDFIPWGIRMPHQSPRYSVWLGNFIGQDEVLKIVHTIPGGSNFVYANPTSPSACDVIADWGLHRRMWGEENTAEASIRNFEVMHETKAPVRYKHLIQSEKREERWLRTPRVIPAQYSEGVHMQSEYTPIFMDNSGNTNTINKHNERCLGMLLEFHDQRFDQRDCNTQYYIAMQESMHKKLRDWIKEDPSVMLHLYGQSFPEHRHSPGKYKDFPHIEKFFFVETLEQAVHLLKSLYG